MAEARAAAAQEFEMVVPAPFVPRPDVWSYVYAPTEDGRDFAVLVGGDPSPIVTLRFEDNAKRIVSTGNLTGYPDIAALAADDKGEVWR